MMDAQLWSTSPHRPKLVYVKILGNSSSTTCCEKKSHVFYLRTALQHPEKNYTRVFEKLVMQSSTFRNILGKNIFRPENFLGRKKFKFFSWSQIISKRCERHWNTFSPIFDHFWCSASTLSFISHICSNGYCLMMVKGDVRTKNQNIRKKVGNFLSFQTLFAYACKVAKNVTAMHKAQKKNKHPFGTRE